MQGDGNGWTLGTDGSKHWGKYGAAGLLVRAQSEDGLAVLLQHRAFWSHEGGTWALPGGARDSHETTTDAALREAYEEAGIDPQLLRVRAELITKVADSGWTYTTVLADAPSLLATVKNRESEELRWVPEHAVTALPLHSAFAEAWPTLRQFLTEFPIS